MAPARVADDGGQAEGEQPDDGQEQPAPTTARSTPGWPRVAWGVEPSRGPGREEGGEGQDLARHQGHDAEHGRLAGQDQRSVGNGGRSVARMVPVLYSALMTRTPRTPMAS